MNPLNRKVRFQSNGPRVLPYCYIKGKGVVLMVDKHRSVRLLEQDVNVYEKTLDKSLRDFVKIYEKQFGFQQGKSTVDAILYYDSCRKSLEQKKERAFPCLC